MYIYCIIICQRLLLSVRIILILCFHSSRAILEYLATQYGTDEYLCPQDPQKKAKVNQLLYFDAALLPRLADYYVSRAFLKQNYIKKYINAPPDARNGPWDTTR